MALDDPSWNVRKQAERILRDLGEATAVARSPEPRYSFDEYLDLLRPPYTPQAFIRTERGVIEVELFVLDAPMTVANFIRLSREGFYNGLSFHRIVPNFVVQTGDPRGDSRGGPGYTIRCGEHPTFVRGTLGAALEGKDCEVVLHHPLPQPQLRNLHSFRQVTAGMRSSTNWLLGTSSATS
jgi:peptidyl-prolyl cis-trans isomerase B (cyclophilin B)